MAGPLGRLRQRMARDWQLRQLRDERWRFLWDEPPPDEWVSFDCETTGLDTRNDEIVAIGADLGEQFPGDVGFMCLATVQVKRRSGGEVPAVHQGRVATAEVGGDAKQ